ncbi:MAG: hypothetical protein LBL76_11325 [Treponema sp.]|jgi:hypothetical protein|nr:hypothetical protein [Treponema sp.]
MKKMPLVLIMFILCIGLSGCIDIFQHITKDGSGIHRNTIKVTVSKTIFAMANGFSGSGEDIDYEKLFDESTPLDVKEYSPFNATVKTVNDTMDIGYLVDMNIDYQDRNTVNKINRSNTSFIPKYNGKHIIIPIACLGGDADPSDDNAMTAAFLATGKYRLAISKKCITNIERIMIKTAEGETDSDFLDLYDEYLVEIPIPIIFMNDIDLIIYSK